MMEPVNSWEVDDLRRLGGDAANAPTLFNSPPTAPFGNNVHLCYRDDGVSFFALEYWPDHFIPRWTSYRIDPANYGPNGCSTFTRAKHNWEVDDLRRLGGTYRPMVRCIAGE